MFKRKRGLAGAGAPGQNDQFAAVQPRGLFVQIRESGGISAQLVKVPGLDDVCQQVQLLLRHRPHGADFGGMAGELVPDRKQEGFNLVQNFGGRVAGGAKGAGVAFAQHAYHLPQHRGVAHQFGVCRNVDGGGANVGQSGDVFRPAAGL